MSEKKLIPHNPKLKQYLISLYENKVYSECAKKLGIDVDYFYRIINNKIIPKYIDFEKIINYAGGNIDDIIDILWETPHIIYKYWDNLYPEAQSKSTLGYIMSDIISSSDMDRGELIKKVGIAQSYLSSIETCIIPLSYNMLYKICEVLDLSVCDVLNKLKDAKNLDNYKQKFKKTVVKARKSMGLSIKEASVIIGINEEKLRQIEDIQNKFTISELTKIVKGYGLDFDELLQYAYYGRLLKRNLPSIDAFYQNNKKNTRKKDYELDIENYFIELCKYKYIVIEDIKETRRIETHTFATLLFLFLTNDNRKKEKYRSQILYYIQNLYKSGNISLDLLSGICDNPSELQIGEVYEICRKIYKFTFAELEEYSGMSRSHINSLIKKNDFASVFACDRFFSIVGLPVCIGYESLFAKPDASGEINFNSLLKDLQLSLTCRFWGETISCSLMRKLFERIISYDDTNDKYDNIKKLPFPTSYNKPSGKKRVCK